MEQHIADEVFGTILKEAASHRLLDLTYCIDSTDLKAMPAEQDVVNC